MILKSMRSCIKMVTSIHKKPDLIELNPISWTQLIGYFYEIRFKV